VTWTIPPPTPIVPPPYPIQPGPAGFPHIEARRYAALRVNAGSSTLVTTLRRSCRRISHHYAQLCLRILTPDKLMGKISRASAIAIERMNPASGAPARTRREQRGSIGRDAPVPGWAHLQDANPGLSNRSLHGRPGHQSTRMPGEMRQRDCLTRDLAPGSRKSWVRLK